MTILDTYMSALAEDGSAIFGTEGYRFESYRACFLFRGQRHLVTKNDAGWTTENVVHPLTRAILSQGAEPLAFMYCTTSP